MNFGENNVLRNAILKTGVLLLVLLIGFNPLASAETYIEVEDPKEQTLITYSKADLLRKRIKDQVTPSKPNNPKEVLSTCINFSFEARERKLYILYQSLKIYL
ncbi:MAG: hypothetical protein RIC03_13455 [Cyclobacteriaceae bacterium]